MYLVFINKHGALRNKKQMFVSIVFMSNNKLCKITMVISTIYVCSSLAAQSEMCSSGIHTMGKNFNS